MYNGNAISETKKAFDMTKKTLHTARDVSGETSKTFGMNKKTLCKVRDSSGETRKTQRRLKINLKKLLMKVKSVGLLVRVNIFCQLQKIIFDLN